jgi:hypothetical protein
MKVKTTVKAGAVVVGVGGILSTGTNTGNNAAGGSSIGSNNQGGTGNIQVNLL